jgi:hypothetical protein
VGQVSDLPAQAGSLRHLREFLRSGLHCQGSGFGDFTATARGMYAREPPRSPERQAVMTRSEAADERR